MLNRWRDVANLLSLSQTPLGITDFTPTPVALTQSTSADNLIKPLLRPTTLKTQSIFTQPRHHAYVTNRFYSTDHRKKSTDPFHQPAYFDTATLAFLLTSLAGTFACFYLFKDYLGAREKKIIQPSVDLKKINHEGYIVDSTDFEYAGEKPSGELSGSIVRNKKTGKIYLKKGAKSKKDLIKEFLIATFLTKARPDEQPSSLIMQETYTNGTARLYTLSEIYPHSMDLQVFISDKNYKEKLAEKPLIGFEEALACDFMFSKQADIKLSNLIIREREDAYVVATIDHEM